MGKIAIVIEFDDFKGKPRVIYDKRLIDVDLGDYDWSTYGKELTIQMSCEFLRPARPVIGPPETLRQR